MSDTTTDTAPESRFYFRQLLSGHHFAQGDQFADQMRNFVYLLGDREKGEAVVIDPAYDIDGILGIVEADGMRLTGALCTHYHADHIGGSIFGFEIQGVQELLEKVDIPLHVQRDEAEFVCKDRHISDANLVQHVGGDVVMVGDIPIELIHTPGHTPGSQCFMLDGALLSGDTLFLDGCGRTDLPGGDAAALDRSINQTLARVPDDSVLFPGHWYAPEPYASMGQTRRTNFVFHG